MNKLYAFFVASIAMLSMGSNAFAAKGWVDVTSKYITNPGFDGNSNKGWTFVSDASSKNVRCNAMEFWNGTFDIYQTLKNLPEGQYRMSVQSYYRCRDNNQGYRDYQDNTEDITAYMYAGSSKKKLASIYSFSFTSNVENGCWSPSSGWGGSSAYFPNTMESATAAFNEGAYWNQMEFTHNGGDMKAGLINQNFVQNNWCIFDNFKLEKYGEIVLATAVNVAPQNRELVIGETVRATATVSPADATNNAVTWKSTNAAIATVDADGLITAIKEGQTTIIATTTDGSNHTAACQITVTRNPATAASLIINEVMVSNVDQYISPAFNFDGWIELYNPTDKSAEIGGLYFSDNETNLKVWKAPATTGAIPAHGFKVIWFDSNSLCHTNANIELDTDGGNIYISDAEGNLITSLQYPKSKERVSYARTTDGGETWAETSEPTPGYSNAHAAYAGKQLDAPTVDQNSQLFTGRLDIHVEIPEGCTLRYTTDGTLPTLTNGATSADGSFSITATANYRFRLFGAGYLASRVTTRSYILKDKNYNLPVIAVVSDPDFLYDDSIGVYVKGVNGKPGNGQSEPCNWNMDWERPVNFSYITQDGAMALNQDVNLEMAGGWSRAWTPHSFKLKGKKELGGNKNLNYPFFTAKPYIRNRTLQIRNGGNDTKCRIIDPALETIIQTSGIDIDLQSYQPAHEFINGQYIGVLNMREPNNKHYVYANYGWDNDEIDQFEMSPDSGYVQKEGTKEAFLQLCDLSANAASADTYEEIKERLDIDAYVNYMAMEFYLGSTDWPQNNIKGFRKTDGGKFRFVSFDLDFATTTSDPFNVFSNKQTHTFDYLYDKNTRITEEIKMVTLFKNLLKNSDFRKRFIDTYCIMGGSVFEADRCTRIIDSLTAIVAPEMALNNESPFPSANNLKNALSSRCPVMMNTIQNYAPMQLQGVAQQNVNLSSDAAGARIAINGIDVPTGKFAGKLFAPVRLQATAPAGYTFKGWQKPGGNLTPIFNMGADWKYYDKGSLDGNTWTSTTYNTGTWSNGSAPFGYGKDGLSTTVSYGGNSSNKYPVCYFRRSFNLTEAPAAGAAIMLDYTVDDGFIVYINGTEAGRYNMPAGTVGFNTFSTTYASGNPDKGQMRIAANLLKKGSNTICVEVHNNSASSSDLYWDASLSGDFGTAASDFYSTESEIVMPEGDVNLVACYEPVEDALKAGYTPVRINEISASNDIYVNEYGKKNDWVELYNTTDQPQDIEGMYITDDAAKLKKCRLTKGSSNANTIIPARGYLVVWCDKQETSRDLHATFKISGDGGIVALTAADESWTDSVSYPAHDGFTTIGRYTDGGNSIYVMNVPTIGKSNVMSSYADLYAVQHSTDIKSTVRSTDSMRMRYAGGQLVIRGGDACAQLAIYTLSGQKVAAVTVNMSNGAGYATVSQLTPGCYVAKAVDKNGNTATCKFIR